MGIDATYRQVREAVGGDLDQQLRDDGAFGWRRFEFDVVDGSDVGSGQAVEASRRSDPAVDPGAPTSPPTGGYLILAPRSAPELAELLQADPAPAAGCSTASSRRDTWSTTVDTGAATD